jgi:hypothetical protein
MLLTPFLATAPALAIADLFGIHLASPPFALKFPSIRANTPCHSGCQAQKSPIRFLRLKRA